MDQAVRGDIQLLTIERHYRWLDPIIEIDNNIQNPYMDDRSALLNDDSDFKNNPIGSIYVKLENSIDFKFVDDNTLKLFASSSDGPNSANSDTKSENFDSSSKQIKLSQFVTPRRSSIDFNSPNMIFQLSSTSGFDLTSGGMPKRIAAPPISGFVKQFGIKVCKIDCTFEHVEPIMFSAFLYSIQTKTIVTEVWNFYSDQSESFLEYYSAGSGYRSNKSAIFEVDPLKSSTLIVLLSHPITKDRGQSVVNYYLDPSNDNKKTVKNEFMKNPTFNIPSFSVFGFTFFDFNGVKMAKEPLMGPSCYLIDKLPAERQLSQLIFDANARRLKQFPLKLWMMKCEDNENSSSFGNSLIIHQIVQTRPQPYLCPFNQSTLRIDSFQFPEALTSNNANDANNLDCLGFAVQVEMKEGNKVIQQIRSKFDPMTFVNALTTRLCFPAISPNFDDTFMIELPFPLTQAHMLTFRLFKYTFSPKVTEQLKIEEVGNESLLLLNDNSVFIDESQRVISFAGGFRIMIRIYLRSNAYVCDKNLYNFFYFGHNNDDTNNNNSKNNNSDNNNNDNNNNDNKDNKDKANISNGNKSNDNNDNKNKDVKVLDLLSNVPPNLLTLHLHAVLHKIFMERLDRDGDEDAVQCFMDMCQRITAVVESKKFIKFLMAYVRFFAFPSSSDNINKDINKIQSILQNPSYFNPDDLEMSSNDQFTDSPISIAGQKSPISDLNEKNNENESKSESTEKNESNVKKEKTQFKDLPFHLKLMKLITKYITKNRNGIDLLVPYLDFFFSLIAKFLSVETDIIHQFGDEFLMFSIAFSVAAQESDLISSLVRSYGMFINFLYDIGYCSASVNMMKEMLRNWPIKEELIPAKLDFIESVLKPSIFAILLRNSTVFKELVVDCIKTGYLTITTSPQPGRLFDILLRMTEIYDSYINQSISDKLIDSIVFFQPKQFLSSKNEALLSPMIFFLCVLMNCNNIPSNKKIFDGLHFLLKKCSQQNILNQNITSLKQTIQETPLISLANSNSSVSIGKNLTRSPQTSALIVPPNSSNNLSIVVDNNFTASSSSSNSKSKKIPHGSNKNSTTLGYPQKHGGKSSKKSNANNSGTLSLRRKAAESPSLAKIVKPTISVLQDSKEEKKVKLFMKYTHESVIELLDKFEKLDNLELKYIISLIFHLINVINITQSKMNFNENKDKNINNNDNDNDNNSIYDVNFQLKMIKILTNLLNKNKIKFLLNESPAVCRILAYLLTISFDSSDINLALADFIDTIFDVDFEIHQNNNRANVIFMRSLVTLNDEQLISINIRNLFEQIEKITMNLALKEIIYNYQNNLFNISSQLIDDKNFLTPSQKAELLMAKFKHFHMSPDAQISILEELYVMHTKNNDSFEASCVAVIQAAIIFENLTVWHKIPNYFRLQHPCFIFRDICSVSTSVKCSEEYMKDPPLVPGFCDSSTFNEQGFISLMFRIFKVCSSNSILDIAAMLIDLCWPIFEYWHSYNELNVMFEHFMKLFSNLADKDSDGQDALVDRFFRVTFFGEKLKEMDNKMYIYRAKPLTHLFDFSNNIVSTFAGIYGKENVVQISESGKIDRKNLVNIKEKVYIQITYVEPLKTHGRNIDNNHDEDESLHLNENDNGRSRRMFYYETPFVITSNNNDNSVDKNNNIGNVVKNEKAQQASVDKQWIRRTILTIDFDLPSLLKRAEVNPNKIVEKEYEPIKVACRQLKDRTAMLKRAIISHDLMKTQQLLHGSLLVQVNEGPAKIADAFLKDNESDDARKLKDSFIAFMREIRKAVGIHATYSTQNPEFMPLQDELEAGYESLKNKLAPLCAKPVNAMQ